MNLTYLSMSIPSLLWATAVTAIAVRRFGLRLRSLGIPLAVLVVGTAICDNLIIAAGLVAYDESKILGFRIGLAPVEDFLYAVVAVAITASTWHILRRRGES